jgi:hypothetical protein
VWPTVVHVLQRRLRRDESTADVNVHHEVIDGGKAARLAKKQQFEIVVLMLPITFRHENK